MSDDAESIVAKYQNGNKLTLDAHGIMLNRPFDIALNATGKIILTENANIEASAGTDLMLQAYR